MISKLSSYRNNNYNIAVIIPTYNRKKYLKKSVESALNQTLRPQEIIIVDDCSKFKTEQYIKDVFPNEVRKGLIKILVNNKNYGAAKSRNVGVKKAKADYIAFLDSDDYWDKKKLEKQINKFKKNPRLDLVYCNQYVVNNRKKSVSDIKMIKENILENLINFWLPTSPSALLFVKRSLKKIGCFDEEVGRSASDHYLWFRIAVENYKIDFVDEPLCYYLVSNKDRNSLNLKNRIKSIKILFQKVKKYMTKEKFISFKNEYIGTVCMAILVEEIKNKNYFKMIFIYLKFLIFNIFFYKRILKKIFNI